MTGRLICNRAMAMVYPAGLVLGLVLLIAAWAGVGLAAGPQSVADLADRLSPAVVNIATSQKSASGEEAVPIPDLPPGSPFREFFDEFLNKQRRDQQSLPRTVSSLGSGFVIDPSGIIVTNNHVIDGADEIEVNLAGGTKMPAELIGIDKKTDLAVLRVKPDKPLAYVSFGDSNKLRVGDWVMAIGNPFGLGGSVTLGIVSARNRNINSGPYDDFIQTDAAINRGNSGGPLFDMDGNVVGINTAIISPSGGSIGIGFSVPSSTARSVIEQLVKFGETRRGWLGVKIQEVNPELVKTLGLDKARGALVADVTPTGPAERAGILAGDVIVRFNGAAINEMRDLPRIVAETAVGTAVTVEVMRQGKLIEVPVELGRLEDGEKVMAQQSPPASDNGAADVLGMKLSAITEDLRSRFKIAEDVEGAVIMSVSPGSAAAEKRLEPGDVISEAGERKITTPDDMRKRVAEVKAEGRSSILLLVLKANRQGDPNFIALRLN